MPKSEIKADVARLSKDIEALSKLTDPERPWTRRPFTPLYYQGRFWLRSSMEALNLKVYQDSASNLIGRLPGESPDLPPILIGSHTDTVMGGGRFDGIIGVLIGLEVVRMLKEMDVKLKHTLEIVDFTAEEPTDFGISTVGSRGMVGNLSDENLSSKDQNGRILAQCIVEAGGNLEKIYTDARKPGSVSLYLEVHIEQGPVLDQSGCPLAVVTGIVGIQRYQITVVGQPDHAGTTPMNMRRDALPAAGELFVALEKICSRTYDEQVVGTVGTVSVNPNAANVVPGEVTFKFEVRSVDPTLIDRVCDEFLSEANRLVKNRGLSLKIEPLTRSEPVVVPEFVRTALYQACVETAGEAIEIPSGAGHDGNQLDRIAPIGMIFVPSLGGRSHCPEEWTDAESIAKGAEALARALIALDKEILQGLPQ